jgi:hypothetical protein
MADWKDVLKADPIEWLLEPDNPSVRYLTLVNILGLKRSSGEARNARSSIMKSGVVPRILAEQRQGSWGAEGRFYRDKYRGTVWQLIILAEHEADGRDPQVREACENLLHHSQDRQSWGFAFDGLTGSSGGSHNKVIPCLTGNMVWSLLRLGYEHDPRVAGGIEWIVRYQRFDDGDGNPPDEWPYDKYQMCWGKHTCHMGVVKAMKALSVIPQNDRSGEVAATIDRGCEYLLAHHIFKQSHHLAKTSKPGWRKLQFPLMYQSDVLEVAGILVDLGVRDDRMQEAVDLIVSKQGADGRWNLENSFNGRYVVDIEEKGKPSKWLTYRSLKFLKGYLGG